MKQMDVTHPLYSTESVLDGFQLSKRHLAMAVLFTSYDRMPLLAPTFDNADPLFTLVITSGFYLHHVEAANQDPASGRP